MNNSKPEVYPYSYLDELKKLTVDGTLMLSEYWLAYNLLFTRAPILLSLLGNDGEYSALKNKHEHVSNFYNEWIRYTDAQFSRRLNSDKFLDSFRVYLEAVKDVNRYAKKNAYCSALSLFDAYIDNFLINILSAIADSPIFSSTNYEIVLKKQDTRLLRYHYYQEQLGEPEQAYPQTRCKYRKYRIPLLMVYAPINRYHILDLAPHRSIVNQFVSRGFDVFVLDWGQQKNNKSTIADYVNYIDDYLQEIKKITNSHKVSLFGYSWGGVLSIMYTALDNNRTIKNLIVHSSQADFDKDKTTIAEWMRSFPVDKFVEEFGEMHGHMIDLAFLMRNPLLHSFDNIKFALDMQKKVGEDDKDILYDNLLLRFARDLFRVSVWLHNTPDIQGEFFKEFAVNMYQKNLLIKSKIMLNGSTKTIDVKNITIPLLNIVGTEDDLVQAGSSIPLNDLVSSTDKKLIQFPEGHVELCISSHSHTNLWPKVVAWLQKRSW